MRRFGDKIALQSVVAAWRHAMERVRVTSSNIVSIGYDPDGSVLEVEFKGGEVYQYTGVTAHHHAGMMNAESHGKYLNSHIKGKYPYRQVR